MRNFVLKICYDGTDYFGWQTTQMGPSIEESLQKVLEKILNHPITLQAASRTDRGVHAHEQIVNFFSLKRPRLESLNALLPPSIRVLELDEKELCFHPTLDVVGKEYLYQIDTTPIQLPFRRHIAWHLPGPLDLEQAKQGVALLIGKHDFSAFCNQLEGRHYDHKVRELWWFDLDSTPTGVVFYLAGNHFLYRMARNLVGTVADLARGKLSLEEMKRALKAKKRTEAGVCAPAHGLTLNKVFYNWPGRYNSPP